MIHFVALNSIPHHVAAVDRGLKAGLGCWSIACQPGVRERISATMLCRAAGPWDPLILSKVKNEAAREEEEGKEEQRGISDRWTLMS